MFVDYLQILAPISDRMTDKQAIDVNITELRHFARDLKTPVLCISSLNRGSYSGVVNMEAFKESGAIEYGADVLFGLQPQGMEEVEDVAQGKQKAKANRILRDNKQSLERACDLVILKNRSGRTGDSIPLKFLPVSNLFLPGTPHQYSPKQHHKHDIDESHTIG